MDEHALAGHGGRTVTLDLCFACQSFWFDQRESLALTPASTLTLFRLIGEHTARASAPATDRARCPRCRLQLRLVNDLQRHTRFQYLACPADHGRFITFFEFLKEKAFVRALTAKQVDELRHSVQLVNCSNCGAPVDLARDGACRHCASPLSMLDLSQAETLVEQLRRAAAADGQVAPDLPLRLARARRESNKVFAELAHDPIWRHDVSSAGLVAAGLHLLARWIRG